MNFRKFRKFRKNVKAISPVISVLLMIAVAVVASLVTYAWVMGYIGFQTAKTGQAVQIQSVTFTADGQVATVYVQNVGDSAITLVDNQCLYVKGTLDTASSFGAVANLTPVTLQPGDTQAITASTPSMPTFNSGDLAVVKVATEGGTYSQVSQLVP